MKLGAGSIVCAGAIVEVASSIGRHVIVNTASVASHHSQVGDYAHLAKATVTGNAIVEEGAVLFVNSTILNRVRVGAWATVSAGSLVTSDVAPYDTVMGIPARSVAQQ